jgi:hypothetical protein
MNHPDELLADLVDGTLDEGDLARVQAHLDICPSCREDIAFATAGRKAARSIPDASAPPDLHQRVVAAAGRRGQGQGQGAPTWYRWAGAVAAAAVVVAIAIALPNVGGGGAGRDQESAEGPMAASSEETDGAGAERQVVEVQDANYDAEGLQELARATGSDAEGVEGVEAGAPTRDDPTAAGCVRKAFDGQPVGRLARLIQARFEGRDAYIAIYLEGPGANEPADTAAVWVAAKNDCSILSFASARI